MIRIANGQGFWGDSLEAPVELVRRGPLDYLTLDYLAEVTMSILQKQRARDPRTGYARDFVDMIARVLPDLKERRVRVIANAGGVNPTACCEAVLWQLGVEHPPSPGLKPPSGTLNSAKPLQPLALEYRSRPIRSKQC